MNPSLLPSCGSGEIFAVEEKRSRWAGRPSKPVGAAWRLRVGSTPALFRPSVAGLPASVALPQHCARKPLSPLALRPPEGYGLVIERAA
jgi:hypothetical protein